MTINGWPVGDEVAYEMLFYSFLPFLFIIIGAILWLIHRVRK